MLWLTPCKFKPKGQGQPLVQDQQLQAQEQQPQAPAGAAATQAQVGEAFYSSFLFSFCKLCAEILGVFGLCPGFSLGCFKVYVFHFYVRSGISLFVLPGGLAYFCLFFVALCFWSVCMGCSLAFSVLFSYFLLGCLCSICYLFLSILAASPLVSSTCGRIISLYPPS